MEMKVNCEIDTNLSSLLGGTKHFCGLNAVYCASYVQELLRCVWRHLVGVLKGESPTLCYTSSLLHTLGSVTVSMAG